MNGGKVIWGHGWLSVNQEERPHQKPSLPAFWSWISILQPSDKINVCFLSSSRQWVHKELNTTGKLNSNRPRYLASQQWGPEAPGSPCSKTWCQSPGWPLPTSSSDSNPCPQHFYGCQEILKYRRAVRDKVRETLCWGLRLRPHFFFGPALLHTAQCPRLGKMMHKYQDRRIMTEYIDHLRWLGKRCLCKIQKGNLAS